MLQVVSHPASEGSMRRNLGILELPRNSCTCKKEIRLHYLIYKGQQGIKYFTSNHI